ncbi:tyrosine-type recombinase/integrase [Candidatus Viridilinea mediisalina]|uniref:Integrase n=1 Tax=Candidatus Viridilinea mediisalina TaxID=2024553 RepID=A0A2A6RK11_9CHLR|nr:tyrosine-type recombinase/integrase [Candidatus Viridilinea mediisalina]PDW03362.1 hypothetical protein CJ255_09255 [Candidatus Viridilinea mediisalina]
MVTDLAPATLDFSVEILAGQLAPATLVGYRRDVAAYLRFAATREAALDPATLARWRAHLANATTLSPRTINRRLAAVKRLIREAASQGYTSNENASAFDQIAGVRAKALKDRLKPSARTRISPSEMRRLCEQPDRTTLLGLRDAALLTTLASSGMRVAEAASLTTSQLVAKGGSYVVLIQGKNDEQVREAPLSREAYERITAWIERRGLETKTIFTSFGGRGQRLTKRPMSSPTVWRIVQRYAHAIGIPQIKPHDLRRFVGTQLAARNIRHAQKALGHKRLDTTANHYILDELEPGLTEGLF